jgi:hypothetical protein
VPFQYLFELLHRAVIVKVVEVVERGQVQGIVRAEGKRFRVRVWSRRHRVRSQQETDQKSDAAWKREKQFFLVGP